MRHVRLTLRAELTFKFTAFVLQRRNRNKMLLKCALDEFLYLIIEEGICRPLQSLIRSQGETFFFCFAKKKKGGEKSGFIPYMHLVFQKNMNFVIILTAVHRK